MFSTQAVVRGRTVLSLVLAAAALLALLIVIAVLSGDRWSWTFGPLHVRVAEAGRPLGAAAVSAVLLWIVAWPRRFGRPVALVCLLAVLFLCFVLIARTAENIPSQGDGTVIESYTIDALHGTLLVGPYSQYRWHHPGPLMFYVMAPFYALSGWRTLGLDAAALAINVLSMLAIAWVTLRYASQTFAVVSTGLTVLFALRFNGLLTSAWNPHVIVFPMMALMFVCAAVAVGRVQMLPLAALLASFVSQTHIGLAPTALAISGAALVGALLTARESADWMRLRRMMGLTAWVAVALWFLPLAEQITHHPGNLTKIWQFFTSGQPRPATGSAFMAWVAAVTGWMRPTFSIAVGEPADTHSPLWASLWAIAQVIAVALLGARSIRDREHFLGAFGLLLVVASILALWSVKNIVGGIADYAVFWMACLGPLSAAILLSCLISLIRLPTSTLAMGASRVSVAALLFIAVGYGVLQEERAVKASLTPSDEQAASQTIASAILTRMHANSLHKPLIAIDGPTWGVAVGVVTQLQKAAVPFAVGQEPVWMLTDDLGATGNEDEQVVISTEPAHSALVKSPGVVTIADPRGYFADVVPVTAPHVAR